MSDLLNLYDVRSPWLHNYTEDVSVYTRVYMNVWDTHVMIGQCPNLMLVKFIYRYIDCERYCEPGTSWIFEAALFFP